MLEEGYVEYGLELILAVLGITAAYFIDFSSPASLAALGFLPVLYGYTAYISREEFNNASLVSLSSLAFLAVGGLTAILALFYSLGNVLVSFFSSGGSFKEFYGSTSLPMLLTGFIVGLTVFAYGSYDPSFQDKLAEGIGEKSGVVADQLISQEEIVERNRNSQMELVNSTALMATRLTAQEVVNRTGDEELLSEFEDAEDSVITDVHEEYSSQFEDREMDLSSRVEDRMTAQISGMSFFLVIPVLTGMIYSLQPLIGFLTAFSAKFFYVIDPRPST